VPGVSNFHELNVRTYVAAGDHPGVWFFSLDAASSIAVLAARTGWHLPYHRASMELEVSAPLTSHPPQDPHVLGAGAGDVRYRSRRLWPGPKPAELELSYRIGESLGEAAPGTFEHFLAERYLLFAHTGAGLVWGQVHHRPYPLHRAEVIEVRESVVAAAGLPATSGPPAHVLYSPGVDVDVFALQPVDGA
jgi:uncharacterized protein YqjF (DUF2071 family)